MSEKEETKKVLRVAIIEPTQGISTKRRAEVLVKIEEFAHKHCPPCVISVRETPEVQFMEDVHYGLVWVSEAIDLLARVDLAFFCRECCIPQSKCANLVELTARKFHIPYVIEGSYAGGDEFFSNRREK